MADPTLDDLLTEKGKKEFFDELVDAAIEEKIPETAWQPGEPLFAVMSVVARVLAALWSLVLPALRAPFLDFAKGPWLTLIAWTFYGTKRKGAEFARQDRKVENRGPGFYTVLPGQIRVKNADNKTFTNTTGGTLAAWSGSGLFPSAVMTFTADEAGIASDTPSGGIVELPITAPSGVFVVTNTAAILGSDEETDEALRGRAKLSAGPLSPAGPWAAYAFVALSTLRADGTPVDVNRVRVVDLGNCSLEVWLAGKSGPTTGNMATAGSDVFLVYQAILKAVKPTGFTCNVYGAAATSFGVTIDIVVDIDAGLTSEEASAAATEAVNDYLSRFPIGGHRKTNATGATDSGRLFAAELAAKASESAEGIISADILSPLDTGALVLGYNVPAEPVIFYNSIPDVALTIVVNMVKQ